MLGTILITTLMGALLVWLQPRFASFIGMLVGFSVLALMLYQHQYFDVHQGYQWLEQYHWLPSLGFSITLAVDGISWMMLLLTAFIFACILMITPQLEQRHVASYVALLLLLEACLLAMFMAKDAVFFFMTYEASLIPIYLFIGIWGGSARAKAAIKLFLFTFLGSTFFLVAIIYLGHQSGTYDLAAWVGLPLTLKEQTWLFWGMMASFMVKMPMIPVHTWLPDAHSEAPTAGSVILAAIMLKMGAYGMLRFILPIVPLAAVSMAPIMIVLSITAIIYIGWAAFAQTDIKRLIAYSSIAHMGFVTLGLFLIMMVIGSHLDAARLAMNGALVQMVAHAFGSGALFLVFGLMYQRIKTRDMTQMAGLAQLMPAASVAFLLFCLTNVALPGTAGFVGEFSVLMALAQVKWYGWAILAASTMVLSAMYTLWMYRRVFMGPLGAHWQGQQVKDLQPRELMAIALLVIAVIALGLYPQWLWQNVAFTTDSMLSEIHNMTLQQGAAV